MENICGKEVYCSAKSVEDEKKQKYLELINTRCSAVKIDIVAGGDQIRERREILRGK